MAHLTEVHPMIPPDWPRLALALAVVKNKPPDTEVKDYISRMRNFIKSSNKLDMPHSEKFFDSVCFWKSAYEKSEAEQARLLNALYDLKQRNLSLLAQEAPRISESNTAVQSSKKRKDVGVLGNVAPSTLNGKRAKSNLSKNVMHNPEVDENDAEPTHDEQRTTSLMRQIYFMQRALQKRGNEKSLPTNAVILCKEAEHSVLDIIQREINSTCQKNTGEPSTGTVFEGVWLSFHLAYRALHKISNASDHPNQGKGQITYYLVCLFESITVALAQFCTAISKPTIRNPKTSKLPRSASTQSKRPRTDKRARTLTRSHASQNEEDKIAQGLTNLLCKMANSLELAKEEDQKVMEGFLFIVLSRVGKMLALFVFNNIQLPSEACPTLKAPEGLESMRQEGLSPDIGQYEAKYLIKLLKGLFPNEMFYTQESSATEVQFVRGMKDRLQKTLLQAVFGTEEPLFQEGLHRPTTPPPQDCDGDRNQCKLSFSEWFTQELWTLVGWDMLNSVVNRS